MGKVKTEQVKRIGSELIRRFPDKVSSNFENNKRVVSTLIEGSTNKVRNLIAGYITHIFSKEKSNKEKEEIMEL